MLYKYDILLLYKCYIKEYKTDVNKNKNNINKPLIDLHTKPKKYNIDNIYFNNNDDDKIKKCENNNNKNNIITITFKKH